MLSFTTHANYVWIIQDALVVLGKVYIGGSVNVHS
jgi:hypothetical protein